MLTRPLESGPQNSLMDASVSPSFVSERRRSPRKNHVTERHRPAPISCQSQPLSPAHIPVFKAREELSFSVAQNQSVPNQSVPNQSVPNQSVPNQSVPNQSVPNQSVPNQLQRSPILSQNQRPTDPDETCRSWVIGPLFQSFKSKMASFTEIVMSPAKLFKASSSEGQNLVQTRTSESADPDKFIVQSRTLESADPDKFIVQSRTLESADPDKFIVQSRTLESAEAVDLDKSVLNLGSEVKFVLRGDGSKLWKNKPEAIVSEEEQTNRSSKTRSQHSKVTQAKVTQAKVTQATQMDLKTDPESVVVLNLKAWKDLKDPKDPNDRTAPSLLDDTRMRKVKRTLNLSEETVKRKKSAAEVEVEEPATKRKQRHKSTTATRPKKKLSEERPLWNLEKEYNGVTLVELRSSDDTRSLEVKAGAVRPGGGKGKKRKTPDGSGSEPAWDLNSETCVKKTEAVAPGGRARRSRKATETRLDTTPRENGDATEDCDTLTEDISWTRLLRSHSCPEIPVLRLDSSWTPHFHSPPRSRCQPPQQLSLPLPISLLPPQQPSLPTSPPPPQQPSLPLTLPSSLPHHFERSQRRERRHTVCSLEVEREIAPLCLRKEVFPSRGPLSPYEACSPIRVLSPGASLSPLASRFLCSPLAFLSTRSEGKSRVHQGPVCPHLTPLTSPVSPSRAHTNHSSSPADHSVSPSLPHSLASGSPLLGLHLLTSDLRPVSCPSEPPSAEDEDDTSSSPESEELREETTQSDSEIKVQKADGRRKVSSIKIRRALPKPQNNLTPMGLPKTVRLKKKEFSLEEIYTNKNYSKAPESRLETIFESPLSRELGAPWCAPRRVKRFLEFTELGEPRRPRRLPWGGAKVTGGGAKVTGGGAKANRRRRGTKDQQESCASDSLLCIKLDQLTAWLHLHEAQPEAPPPT